MISQEKYNSIVETLIELESQGINEPKSKLRGITQRKMNSLEILRVDACIEKLSKETV